MVIEVESAVCDHIFDLPEQNRRVAVECVAGGIFGSEKCSSQLHSAAAQNASDPLLTFAKIISRKSADIRYAYAYAYAAYH